MKRQAFCLFVVVVFPLSLTCAFAEQIYVDADAAAGADNGSNWVDAYLDLQSALLAASSGDEILVAQGTYKPAGPSGDRAATFQLINGVAIKGGYAGWGEVDPNERNIELYETILSGDLNDNDDPNFAHNDENSLHVVTGSGTDRTAVIDGFTVTAGNANIADSGDQGGGMFTFQGDPTITNCTFSKNYALYMGGGVFNRQSCPLITNCTIIDNRSDDDGGGMRNYDNSHAVITNCKFINNSAGDEAGGMANRKNSNSIVTYCTFIGNVSVAGGGMENHVGKATPTGEVRVANCIFIGNTATGGEGGGMRSNDPNPTTSNCIFIDNIGGGMHNMDNIPIVVNCIFWGNSGGSLTGNGVPIVTFCNVEGGFPGTGNIDTDPCFVGPDDYHLSSNSPCIDAGDPNYILLPGETDFDGLPRIMNGRIDMGVYEYEVIAESDPPTPNPATFTSAPTAISPTEITMSATLGSDVSGPVEYYFAETSGNPGATDSGWQLDTSYTDTDLDPYTQYTYTLQMRDNLLNTGGLSTPASATTWGVVPAITSTEVTSVTVNQPYSYDVDAIGIPTPDYSLVTHPYGMTIDTVSGLISWTPDPNQLGANPITVDATNSQGTDSQSFTITVFPGDDFNDNKRSAMWRVFRNGLSNIWIIEDANQLNVRSIGSTSYQQAAYITNGWSIDVSADFQMKVDFHFSGTDPNYAWVGITIEKGNDYAALSAGSHNGEAYYYADANSISEQISRASDDGVLYVSYDSTLDELYLGYTGYDFSNSWKTISGLLGASGSVDVLIGGGTDGVILTSGRAYLDNFELSTAALLGWPPATDLDQSGFIDLGDIAVMSDHWLADPNMYPIMKGDINRDDIVNYLDFTEIKLAW